MEGVLPNSNNNVMSSGISCEIKVTVENKEDKDLPVINQTVEPENVRKTFRISQNIN